MVLRLARDMAIQFGMDGTVTLQDLWDHRRVAGGTTSPVLPTVDMRPPGG